DQPQMPVGAAPAPGHSPAQGGSAQRLLTAEQYDIQLRQRFQRLLPVQFLVTKAGSQGNGKRLEAAPTSTHKQLKPLILKDFKKMARQLLYIWHNNNNKQCPT